MSAVYFVDIDDAEFYIEYCWVIYGINPQFRESREPDYPYMVEMPSPYATMDLKEKAYRRKPLQDAQTFSRWKVRVLI